jgi:hypothetical protein
VAIFRQIHVQLWADENIEELSPLAILTFIYLFSNSHRNEAALYHLTIKKISNETNQDMEQAAASLAELVAKDRVCYDKENCIVWVKNALKYQSISPKGIIAIKKAISKINSPLVEEFKAHYSSLLGDIDTHSIPLGYPLNTHSNGNASPTDTQAGNGKGKGKKESDAAPAPSKEVANYLKDKLKARGVYIPRDWHLKAYATSAAIINSGVPPEELRACIDWALDDPYWVKQIDGMSAIERALPKFQAQRKIPDEGARADPALLEKLAKHLEDEEKALREWKYPLGYGEDDP